MSFEKVQIKSVNVVICGKKLNARATGNKLVFYFGLILLKHVVNMKSIDILEVEGNSPCHSMVVIFRYPSFLALMSATTILSD